MKKLLVPALVYLLMNCQRETPPDPDSCSAPRQVTTDAGCYVGNGLTMQISGDGAGTRQFEWTIIANDDTTQTSGFGWQPNKDVRLINAASTRFVVPDSIVRRYKRIGVQVRLRCGSQQLMFMSAFAPVRSAGGSCVTWTRYLSF